MKELKKCLVFVIYIWSFFVSVLNFFYYVYCLIVEIVKEDYKKLAYLPAQPGLTAADHHLDHWC